jgi:hypothetical protein
MQHLIAPPGQFAHAGGTGKDAAVFVSNPVHRPHIKETPCPLPGHHIEVRIMPRVVAEDQTTRLGGHRGKAPRVVQVKERGILRHGLKPDHLVRTGAVILPLVISPVLVPVPLAAYLRVFQAEIHRSG